MTKLREDYSEELASQYLRLERLHDKILENFESQKKSKNSEERLDDVYDFFTVCYHLREWIEKDKKVGQTIKDKLPTFTKEDSPVQFKMCRDLCNKSKHANLEESKKYKPNDVNTKIVTYGGSIFKVSTDELKEANEKGETIHLKKEGEIFLGNYAVSFLEKSYDLKGTVQACMHVWKTFFKENDLLLPRTTPKQ